MVATQAYPSSPESRTSTICVDLDAFASECSASIDGPISVSLVGCDYASISSVNSGDDISTTMDVHLCRFQPLSCPCSPVNVLGGSQIVVESPLHYEPPAVPVYCPFLVIPNMLYMYVHVR